MTIYNFELLNVPFANTATSGEIAPFPDYNKGLGIAFDQTDGKPEMKGLNGLFKMMTTSIIYLKQRGISEWDANLEYVAGKSFVVDGDKLYQAKTTNINKQPSLSQNDWILNASVSNIEVSKNGNIKRSESSDGTITLEVPTASTDQRGVVRQATSTEVANKSNVNAYVTPKNVADIVSSSTTNVGQTRQTWRNLTSSRSSGQTYTNNTGNPINVFIAVRDGYNGGLSLVIGGVTIFSFTYDLPAGAFYPISVIIPNNTNYSFAWAGGRPSDLLTWSELR